MNLSVSPEPGTPAAALRQTAAVSSVALRDLVLAQIDAADALLSGAPETLHHGVHHARKAIRRTRAALALGAGELGPSAERIDEELRRWCRGLSSLRDTQALVETLQRLDDDDFAAAGDREHAIGLARQRRDRALDSALSRDPGFASRRARLVRVRRRIETLPWQHVDHARAVASLAKAGKRVEKAQHRAKRHPDRDADWHRLRRRIRRVRQMQTLAAAAFGITTTLAAGSDEIADALGLAQDDSLVLRVCRSSATFPPAIRRALRDTAGTRIRHARR